MATARSRRYLFGGRRPARSATRRPRGLRRFRAGGTGGRRAGACWRAGFQPSRRTVIAIVAPAELQRFVAAPHVDVDVAALDRRAGIHDGVDAVVPLAQSIDLDDRADRQQVGVGGGDPGPDVHPGRGRRSLAVGGGGEPEPGAWRRERRRFAELRLPGGVARIENRHLVQQGERDGRHGGRDDLAPDRARQKHRLRFPWGAGETPL